MSSSRGKSSRPARARGAKPKVAPERTAAAVIVGNELLSGKIADQNLSVLAVVLRKLGVRLDHAVTLPDDLPRIARAVRAAARAHTWVFTSGGVGPTHDDVTVAAVARALGRKVVVHPQMDQLIRRSYGDQLREGHLFMARVPEGTRLVKSPEVPWPAMLAGNVWILPGVPEIFRLKMKLVESVIEASIPFVSLAVLTSLDEGNLKPLLDRVVAAHPAVDVGSYPRWTDPHARTKLTFDGRDAKACEAARQDFAASLPEGTLIGLEG